MLDAVHISDLHLGAAACQVGALRGFLENLPPTRRLILGGDVLQETEHRLGKHHWGILSLLRKLSDTLELVWVRGNHDHDAESVAHLVGARWCEYHAYESGGLGVLTVHGDAFDSFIRERPYTTWLADTLYLRVQRWSARLAMKLKRGSKAYLRNAQKVRALAVHYARARDAEVVVCGHTHHAEGGGPPTTPSYWNTGCWTEEVGHALLVGDGRFELVEVSEKINEEVLQ